MWRPNKQTDIHTDISTYRKNRPRGPILWKCTQDLGIYKKTYFHKKCIRLFIQYVFTNRKDSYQFKTLKKNTNNFSSSSSSFSSDVDQYIQGMHLLRWFGSNAFFLFFTILINPLPITSVHLENPFMTKLKFDLFNIARQIPDNINT